MLSNSQENRPARGPGSRAVSARTGGLHPNSIIGAPSAQAVTIHCDVPGASAGRLAMIGAYIDAGLALIPLRPRDKQPLVKWRKFRERPPDRRLVGAWLRRWPRANWGVILGPVSGNLVALDFDDLSSYERWARDWPDLAQAAPTTATRRGRHVYLMTPGQRTARMTNFNGEVKGAGGYTLLPPSIHPSGARYCWLHGDVTRYVPRVGDLDEIGIELQQPSEWKLPAWNLRPGRTPRALKPCAAAVLTGATPEGQRNWTAWRLALHLRSEGWSEAAALYLMAPWAERSGTPAVELARTVGSAYRPDRLPGHGCRSPELSPFCDSTCTLARFLERG